MGKGAKQPEAPAPIASPTAADTIQEARSSQRDNQKRKKRNQTYLSGKEKKTDESTSTNVLG